MTVDGLELLYKVRIFGEFRRLSEIWEPTTAKRMNRLVLSATALQLLTH